MGSQLWTTQFLLHEACEFFSFDLDYGAGHEVLFKEFSSLFLENVDSGPRYRGYESPGFSITPPNLRGQEKSCLTTLSSTGLWGNPVDPRILVVIVSVANDDTRVLMSVFIALALREAMSGESNVHKDT
jgi:hypothetical protein